jgi:hypothetical protein
MLHKPSIGISWPEWYFNGKKIHFELGFGQRLASGRSEAQTERRRERSRSATPPPTADGSSARLALSDENERAGEGDVERSRISGVQSRHLRPAGSGEVYRIASATNSGLENAFWQTLTL